jgi:IS5 family transposase
MRNLFLGVACILCLLLSVGSGQTAPQHHTMPSTAVRGIDHPELIPDDITVRMFALVSAPEDTDDSATVERKHFQIARVGVSSADEAPLTQALTKFRRDFKTLTDTYNKNVRILVESGGDATAGYKAFTAQKERMTQRLQREITQSMSAEGAAKFSAFVQQEKAHMTISAQ